MNPHSSNKEKLPPEYRFLDRPRPTFLTPAGAEWRGVMILGVLFTLSGLIFILVWTWPVFFRQPGSSPNSTLGGLGGLLLLIGMGIMVAARRGQSRIDRLRQSGQQTEAVVFDRWTMLTSEESLYLVAYAFKIPNLLGNMQIHTYAEDNREVYDKCQIGDTITVQYLPEDPNICQVIARI